MNLRVAVIPELVEKPCGQHIQTPHQYSLTGDSCSGYTAGRGIAAMASRAVDIELGR
jgi:hypothetical protein